MDHDPSTCDTVGCTAMPCKLAYWRTGGLQVDPRAMPSRRNSVAPAVHNNSYEAGIWRDHRGMPRLDPTTLEPLPIKDRENKSHLYETPDRISVH